MIISENIEKYDRIKKYVEKLEMHIKKDMYNESNRWFYLHVTKD
jgi:hypothetical protein